MTTKIQSCLCIGAIVMTLLTLTIAAATTVYGIHHKEEAGDFASVLQASRPPINPDFDPDDEDRSN